MFEGALYPENDRWFDVIERHKVSILYTAPTAIRAFMKVGTEPVESTTSLFEVTRQRGRADQPRAWVWYYENIGGGHCPIVDTWWQTETAAIMISPLPGLTAAKPGSATFPLPGIDVGIFDEEGNEIEGPVRATS
jgi:acetyl-CoA synthetase